MIEQTKRVYTSRTNPAVMAIWVALLAVTKLLPSLPILGTGSTFSISSLLTPLAGILFGPWVGMVIAGAGGFLGQLLAPHTAWMGIFTFLIGTIGSGCAGFVLHGKGWVSLVIIILGGVLWSFHPIGREALIYPAVYYGSGIVTVLIGAFWGNRWMKGKSRIKRFAAVFLAAYSGFVGASAFANYIGGLLIMAWPSAMWKGLTLVSPLERILFSLGTSIIGVPLIIGLPKIGIELGPHRDEVS